MTTTRSATRRPHAQRSRETQQRLVRSAIDIIQDKGYEAATIFEVAKSAGMTPGAVQHHFDSKAVLMMRVLEELLAEGIRAGELWPDANLPLPERAHAFVQNFWKLTYGQPRFLAAWSIYLGSRSQPDVMAHVAQARAQLRLDLHRSFLQAFPELSSLAEPAAFMDVVLSGLRGLGMLALFDTEGTTITPQLHCLATLIVTQCSSPAVPPTH